MLVCECICDVRSCDDGMLVVHVMCACRCAGRCVQVSTFFVACVTHNVQIYFFFWA